MFSRFSKLRTWGDRLTGGGVRAVAFRTRNCAALWLRRRSTRNSLGRWAWIIFERCFDRSASRPLLSPVQLFSLEAATRGEQEAMRQLPEPVQIIFLRELARRNRESRS